MYYSISSCSNKTGSATINKYYLSIIVFSLGFLLLSCSSSTSSQDDSGGGDPPPEDPNRLVSYSQDIQPIFNGNCATSGCHDAGSVSSGVNLSDYNATMNSTGNQYEKKIVDPGNPNNSPLVDKIEENPDEGSRMPENGSALEQAEIDSIKAWIDDGAPDN
ncbi:c-type cytochrome domain-containing protein [Fodinibius saliphilus]|uniref:c-type cytochrome domain-containing protein n=1 Tax=Fodinibius saliphilus TaxID=1920650 RepID=UPI001108A41E|nr:c-type cytochrome domain-containing protein [Fodinibius saliphilus]